MPAFAGMTVGRPPSSYANFWDRTLACRRKLIEFAQQNGKFFLLRLFEVRKNLGDTFLKERNRALIKLGPLIRQHHVHHAPVVFIPFAHDHFFLFEPVDDARQVAHRDHHLRADFAERQSPGVTDGREHVKLRRRQTGLFQLGFQLLMRKETEAQEANPKAGRVGCKEGTLVNGHAGQFIHSGAKKQLGFSPWSSSAVVTQFKMIGPNRARL